jgi:hypothetical protein
VFVQDAPNRCLTDTNGFRHHPGRPLGGIGRLFLSGLIDNELDRFGGSAWSASWPRRIFLRPANSKFQKSSTPSRRRLLNANTERLCDLFVLHSARRQYDNLRLAKEVIALYFYAQVAPIVGGLIQHGERLALGTSILAPPEDDGTPWRPVSVRAYILSLRPAHSCDGSNHYCEGLERRRDQMGYSIPQLPTTRTNPMQSDL